MTHTVTIIGAGPGGLACAMLLANAGIRVRVIERLGVPGGRTSTISTPEGFRFDLGPTFFLYPRVLEEIFSTCGYDLRHEVEMVRLDPQYRLVFGAGGELLATPDIDRMEAEVSRLSPADRGSFTRFMRPLARSLPDLPRFLKSPLRVGGIWQTPISSNYCHCSSLGKVSTRNSAHSSPTNGSASPLHFSRNIWACRPFAARACFQSCRSWNTSMAYTTQLEAVARSRLPWPESPKRWVWRSTIRSTLSRCDLKADASERYARRKTNTNPMLRSSTLTSPAA